jgi:hypothetical protein
MTRVDRAKIGRVVLFTRAIVVVAMSRCERGGIVENSRAAIITHSNVFGKAESLTGQNSRRTFTAKYLPYPLDERECLLELACMHEIR